MEAIAFLHLNTRAWPQPNYAILARWGAIYWLVGTGAPSVKLIIYPRVHLRDSTVCDDRQMTDELQLGQGCVDSPVRCLPSDKLDLVFIHFFSSIEISHFCDNSRWSSSLREIFCSLLVFSSLFNIVIINNINILYIVLGLWLDNSLSGSFPSIWSFSNKY